MYYSECIDLNLLARGKTKAEAVGRLQEQVFTYLDLALQGDRDPLIPRLSPLPNRVRYHLHLFFHRLKHLFSRDESHNEYDFKNLGVTFSGHC
jgi:hypothetical protein